MTENPEVRYVDTGSATLDAVETERLHEEFEIEMSRAALNASAMEQRGAHGGGVSG